MDTTLPDYWFIVQRDEVGNEFIWVVTACVCERTGR